MEISTGVNQFAFLNQRLHFFSDFSNALSVLFSKLFVNKLYFFQLCQQLSPVYNSFTYYSVYTLFTMRQKSSKMSCVFCYLMIPVSPVNKSGVSTAASSHKDNVLQVNFWEWRIVHHIFFIDYCHKYKYGLLYTNTNQSPTLLIPLKQVQQHKTFNLASQLLLLVQQHEKRPASVLQPFIKPSTHQGLKTNLTFITYSIFYLLSFLHPLFVFHPVWCWQSPVLWSSCQTASSWQS